MIASVILSACLWVCACFCVFVTAHAYGKYMTVCGGGEGGGGGRGVTMCLRACVACVIVHVCAFCARLCAAMHARARHARMHVFALYTLSDTACPASQLPPFALGVKKQKLTHSLYSRIATLINVSTLIPSTSARIPSLFPVQT